MRFFLAALLGLGIMLPTLATLTFAQGNQQGQGEQAAGSKSGQTGTVGNQGNDKDVGNAGGTHKSK